MAIFGAGDSNEPSAVELLEEARKHLPLYLLLDLVEAHYRSRRNKWFASAVGILATAVAGSGAGIYSMYTNYVQQALVREPDARDLHVPSVGGGPCTHAHRKVFLQIC